MCKHQNAIWGDALSQDERSSVSSAYIHKWIKVFQLVFPPAVSARSVFVCFYICKWHLSERSPLPAPSRAGQEKGRLCFFFWKQNCQSTKNFETINWQCLFSFKLSHIYTLTIYSIHVLLQKGEKKQTFVLPASCFAKNKFRIAMNEIAMAS